MDIHSALVVVLVSIVLSAFFSGMEIAFASSNRIRAGVDARKQGISNRIVNMFYWRPDMFMSAMLVGYHITIVVCALGLAELASAWFVRYSGNEAIRLILQLLTITAIIFVGVDFLPKTAFRINPNLSLRYCAVPLYVVYLVIYPISWAFSALSRLLMKLFGAKSVAEHSPLLSVNELDDYIQQSMEESKEDSVAAKEIEHEVKIFRNALDFSDTLLRDCMIPRNEIVAVDLGTTDREQLQRKFTESGLSKIIVYDGEIDNVVGYIHVNELFDVGVDWKSRIKSLEFAPESMLANTMMRKMLSEKKSMAIIVDEFGGTGGLVTLEDLVEEIFGDFEDEHDRRRIVEEQIGDNVFKFSGRIEIELINEKYQLSIPESEEYQTLAGYILSHLGNMPEQNDSFEIDGLKFTILRKSATRIEIVRVEKLRASQE